VKRALSSGPSSRGFGSRSDDNGSEDSPQSSSFVPSPHRIAGSGRYLAHDGIPAATDSDDISIRTTKEMEKYESLHRRESAHTRVYDVSLCDTPSVTVVATVFYNTCAVNLHCILV
jgi:hypothetical protein